MAPREEAQGSPKSPFKSSGEQVELNAKVRMRKHFQGLLRQNVRNIEKLRVRQAFDFMMMGVVMNLFFDSTAGYQGIFLLGLCYLVYRYGLYVLLFGLIISIIIIIYNRRKRKDYDLLMLKYSTTPIERIELEKEFEDRFRACPGFTKFGRNLQPGFRWVKLLSLTA
jgi:hypothetical protein